MKFEADDIKRFQEMYFKNEGRRISQEEAIEIMTSLTLMMDSIYHQVPAGKKEELNKLKNTINHGCDPSESFGSGTTINK